MNAKFEGVEFISYHVDTKIVTTHSTDTNGDDLQIHHEFHTEEGAKAFYLEAKAQGIEGYAAVNCGEHGAVIWENIPDSEL